MNTNGTKPWYLSKILWTGVMLFLMGIIPVISALVGLETISSKDVIEAVAGVLLVIWRVWFTNQTLA